MIWTMPRPVLTWVAGLLGAAALGSFVMGIINAPERGGRLPGERAAGQPAGGVAVINATEATPLSQERIEAPAKPAPKATNTDASDDEDTSDQAPTNAIPPAKALNATPPTVVTPAPVNATPATPPPEDEPPH